MLQTIRHLEQGDRLSAADFMRTHLEQARRKAVTPTRFMPL
ncbi:MULTISPECIES: hypothetical protein [Dickeya]